VTGAALAALLEAQGYDFRPANLTHVVFDNALYGSTGGQASPSRAVGLHHLARAAGYARAIAVAGADELHAAVVAAVAGGGPSFILARVTGEEQPAPRIPYSPEEIRDRFRSGFGAATSTRTPR
jgi:thiamine pyrophosphate-dependent acetolactate synthase large subunit-like protein